MSRTGDKVTTIEQLRKRTRKFRDDRGWNKHHSPKNLAISIALEAAELLENFQWGDYTLNDKQDLERELADVIIYCLFFADAADIDITQAVTSKLDLSDAKYPSKFFNSKNDPARVYKKIKESHRKNKS